MADTDQVAEVLVVDDRQEIINSLERSERSLFGRIRIAMRTLVDGNRDHIGQSLDDRSPQMRAKPGAMGEQRREMPWHQSIV